MRGKSKQPHFVVIYSKSYRNSLAHETILEICDKSLYTDNNITDVSLIERKWRNVQKNTILYHFQQRKIWNFHIFSRPFILHPMAQWANLMLA